MNADRRVKGDVPSLSVFRSGRRRPWLKGRFSTLALGASREKYALPYTGEVVLGRAETCHIVVNHRSVSRANTRITTIRGEAAVTDLESRNGTRVNGKLITGPHALACGDVIAIHDVELTFHEAAGSHDDSPTNESGEYAAPVSGSRSVSERSPSFPVLQDEIAELTARRIAQALEATGGNQTRAAKLIGMPLRTFISKLKELKPSPPSRDGGSE